MRTDVVLPCLDEAAALPWLLSRMPPGFRAIVADNGSVDGSPDIARDLGATVVHVPRRGYGAACHAGVEASSADLVCVMDADATLDPQDLPAVCAPLRDGDADLVVGRRISVTARAWSLPSRAANAALAYEVRRRTGMALRDLGPVRAAWRVPLLGLGLRDRGSGYPLETVVAAAGAGWRVGQVAVGYHPRVGRSKVTGSVRGYVTAVRDMRSVLAR
jgi:glycosyltransferase involved in cell wall biosynthesis